MFKIRIKAGKTIACEDEEIVLDVLGVSAGFEASGETKEYIDGSTLSVRRYRDTFEIETVDYLLSDAQQQEQYFAIRKILPFRYHCMEAVSLWFDFADAYGAETIPISINSYTVSHDYESGSKSVKISAKMKYANSRVE